MRRLKGLNSAAITRVETTMASCGCSSWPVRALKSCLGRRHAPEVHQRKHSRERAVDEGAVYDDVYVVEAVAQDGYPYGDRNGRYQG